MSSTTNNLQLRVKTKNGQFLIDTLNGTNSIGELKSVIWSVTEMHPDNCRLRMGYPPKEIFLVDDEQLINEIIPNQRETMIMDDISETSDNSTRSVCIKNDIQPSQHEPKPFQPDLLKKMSRIEVPANNSCLFISVYFCLTGHMQEKCPELRNLIAETVKSDPLTYNEGFLGKPNKEYCTWIKNEDHWGGGIELSILSNYYEVEIVAVDTQNIRLNRFGEDKSYPRRIFLIFDGIHYDPLVVYTNDENNPIQTSFPSDDLSFIEMALAVAKKAKSDHQYTDLNRMYLKCNQCNKTFDQTDARSHASSTGHLNFSELKDK